jgi:hypothetical protein
MIWQLFNALVSNKVILKCPRLCINLLSTAVSGTFSGNLLAIISFSPPPARMTPFLVVGHFRWHHVTLPLEQIYFRNSVTSHIGHTTVCVPIHKEKIKMYGTSVTMKRD